MIGSAAIAACAVVAAIAYHGTAGEPFSPLNHYVSELGELGVSSLAVLFNSGLIVGGFAFAVFMVGLGRARGGIGGSAYASIGAVAGVAGAAVGVFPLNSLERHTIVTFFFFNLGWIAVALASVDILVRPDPRFRARIGAVGLVAVAAFVGFIWAYAIGGRTTNGVPPDEIRPRVDVVTVFEWLAIAGIVVWTAIAGWEWHRAQASGA
jgi:hypothetical membrane protein